MHREGVGRVDRVGAGRVRRKFQRIERGGESVVGDVRGDKIGMNEARRRGKLLGAAVRNMNELEGIVDA